MIQEQDDDLKPCPHCGGRCDPKGWLNNSGVSGPECVECGATAYSVDSWNARHSEAAQTIAALRAERDELRKKAGKLHDYANMRDVQVVAAEAKELEEFRRWANEHFVDMIKRCDYFRLETKTAIRERDEAVRDYVLVAQERDNLTHDLNKTYERLEHFRRARASSNREGGEE